MLSLCHAPSLELKQEMTCSLCKREMEEGTLPASLREQFKRLDPACGFGELNPCIVCRRIVPDKTIYNLKYQQRVSRYVTALKLKKVKYDQKRVAMEADRAWPKNTKSLIGRAFTGACPSCSGSDMKTVDGDFYECPSCRMQIQLAEGGACIREQKGLADFKDYGGKIETSASANLNGWVEIVHDFRVGE